MQMNHQGNLITEESYTNYTGEFFNLPNQLQMEVNHWNRLIQMFTSHLRSRLQIESMNESLAK